MIHIFDKLYITYAETVVGADSHERIADDYIQLIDKGLGYIDNNMHRKRRFFYAKNLTEMINHFESEKDFFDKIQERLDFSSTSKLIIYADEVSMIEFLIRWWKGIFPNLTIDGLSALYFNYADSEIIQLAKTRNYLNIAVDCAKVPYKNLSTSYWRKSKEELRGLFELYPAFAVPNFARFKCSIEFKFIDYHLNNNSEYLHFLIQKMSKIYKKAFVNEVCGIKRMVERNLYSIALLDKSFSDQILFGADTMEDFIKNHPKLNFLRDDNIKEGKDTFDYLNENYNLLKLSKILIEYDLLLNKQFGLGESLILLDNPYVGYFAKFGEHPKPLNLIKDELSHKSQNKIFKRMIEKNKYNPYLVPAFTSLDKVDSEASKKLKKEFCLQA